MNLGRCTVIRSQGIGEIFLNEWEHACYQADHFSFNNLKEIPFLNYFWN